MTINADPIAIGARLPAPGSMTHIPMVRTRKNVPMNSVRYFFIDRKVRFGGSLVAHFINTTTFAGGLESLERISTGKISCGSGGGRGGNVAADVKWSFPVVPRGCRKSSATPQFTRSGWPCTAHSHT